MVALVAVELGSWVGSAVADGEGVWLGETVGLGVNVGGTISGCAVSVAATEVASVSDGGASAGRLHPTSVTPITTNAMQIPTSRRARDLMETVAKLAGVIGNAVGIGAV